MKIRPIIMFCITSSLFLFCLISIWKILATLQGNEIKQFNFVLIFALGFLVSLIYLIIGNKPTKKKVDSAKELNIQIISQKEWLKMLD